MRRSAIRGGSALWGIVGIAFALTGCGRQPDAAAAPGASRTVSTASAESTPPTMTVHAHRDAGVPVFDWQPVPGATSYGVLVYAAGARAPTWLWSGTATQVRYGAWPDGLTMPESGIRDVKGAPSLASGAEWRVIALDANGAVLAMIPRTRVP
jgi:hypothetical protein